MMLTRRHLLKSGVATATTWMAQVPCHMTGALGKAQPCFDGPWDSPWLSGNYAPVHEEVSADRLAVIGRIPEELNGLYLRNGPNPQFAPRGDYHWFDGDGMVHGVRLQGGKASYRNRYIRTEFWQAEREAGRALWGGLNDGPDLAKMIRGEPWLKNAANTSLIWHGDRLLALYESGRPYELAIPSLKTVGQFDNHGQLQQPFAAHPKIDPSDGRLFGYGYSPVPPYLVHWIISADGTIERTINIDLAQPVMMHDFAMTENHVLFLDFPVTFSLARMVLGEPLLKYEPDRGARIGVLPKGADGQEIRWFEVNPGYAFHTVNACEQIDHIGLTACRYDRYPSAFGMGDPNRGENLLQEPAKLYRWQLNLTDGTVTEGPLDDRAVELPRINDSYTGRNARFGYTLGSEMNSTLKYDLQTGEVQAHHHGPHRFAGEAVFVPRASSIIEDDGWLLTYLYDRENHRSEMVLIDARQMDAEPVARILLPHRVPYGFYGTWLDEDQWRGT